MANDPVKTRIRSGPWIWEDDSTCARLSYRREATDRRWVVQCFMGATELRQLANDLNKLAEMVEEKGR